MSERTPQDVLREALIATGRAHPDDVGFAADLLVAAEDRGLKISLDKAIAEAPDSPPDTLTEAAKNSGLTSGNLRRGPRYGGFMPFGDERTPGEPAAPDTLSEKPELDALIEDGRKWQAAEAEGHIVTFSATGYGLQHPPSCRPNLIDCLFNRYLASRRKPARAPGRYSMKLDNGKAEYARLASTDSEGR